MARPRKSPEDRRALRVAFRLSAPDAEALAARAQAAGMPIGVFAREMALSGRVSVSRAEGPAFETLDQLRRIGVNLNQLTRAYHRRGVLPPDHLRGLCERIEALIVDAQEGGDDRA